MAFLLVMVVRIWMAATLELAPDEAYYWTWAQRLDAGYFDHPPGIAWLIAASTALIGDTPLGVRAGPLLLGALTAWLQLRTSERLFSDPVRADDSLLALLLVPMATVGGLLATPDCLLALGWALALWALAGRERARDTGPLAIAAAEAALENGGPARQTDAAVGSGGTSPAPRGSPLAWLWIGVGVGLACMAKLTGGLLAVLMTGYVFLRQDLRSELRTVWPWAGLLLMMMMVSPFLWWNLHHGWVSFRFQLGHGLNPRPSGGLGGLLAFLGGQLVLVGPIVFILCLRAMEIRHQNISDNAPGVNSTSPHLLTVRWFSIPILLLFALASLRSRGEPNWSVPAYLIAILAIPWSRLSSGLRNTALGSAGILSLLLILQASLRLLPLPQRSDPTAQFFGWGDLGRTVARELENSSATVVTDRYQEAAALTFILGPGFAVTALPGRGRPDQYDFWPPPRVPGGSDVLWVNRAGKGSGPPFKGFSRVSPPLEVRVGRAGQERTYHLYRLSGALEPWTVGSLTPGDSGWR